MEIGIRWRPPAATTKRALSEDERAALKHELTRKRLYTRRIRRFYELLANVEEQIALIEELKEEKKFNPLQLLVKYGYLLKILTQILKLMVLNLVYNQKIIMENL